MLGQSESILDAAPHSDLQTRGFKPARCVLAHEAQEGLRVVPLLDEALDEA